MKLIAIIILGMGMMGSAVVQAQEAGQGSAVPRQPVLVAQAGTVSPEVAAAPAAPSIVLPVLIGVGVIAAVAASGSSSSTNH